MSRTSLPADAELVPGLSRRQVERKLEAFEEKWGEKLEGVVE